MIVQISMVRNELPLIKELLPVWKKYADGFVFLLDTNTDDTLEYLKSVSEEYNILDILEYKQGQNQEVWIETDQRQRLFDTALKYTDKILCLDADEYLDGVLTKVELEQALDEAPDTVFHLRWVQYTSADTIRVDGPWGNNYKDRIGSYSKPCKFIPTQMHSTHLPYPENQIAFPPDKLFIAHLQWLNKEHVAIKQYFWKVMDYITSTVHNMHVAGNAAYDASINNFEWEEEYFDYSLRIREDVFENIPNSQNYRVDWIKQQVKKYNIPNLGDWGYNIQDSIPMYFCTVADEKHYPILLNMIGSIHKHNYYDVEEILVYDLGLSDVHKKELQNIKKVKVCEIEQTNPDIFSNIETGKGRHVRGLFSWKPVVIKDALDRHPYTLYLDAGTTILKPLNKIFKHIEQNGYLLFDCGHSIKWMTTQYLIDKLDLNSNENKWILGDEVFGIDAGFQGVSRSLYDSYVIPMYEFSKDIKNFTDDSTCPEGWGTGRHDQTLYSILARQLKLDIQYHDDLSKPATLTVDDKKTTIHLAHNPSNVSNQTTIFRSRWNINYNSYKETSAYIRRHYVVSVITGIGGLDKYEKFIPQYFETIQKQNNFNRIEFIIVYSSWSNLFDSFTSLENVKFIKEDQALGVYNAWNIGILNSTAEYVTNWNVDDVRFPINNRIKYDLLSKNLGIDLAYNYYVALTQQELQDDVDINSKPFQQYPDEYHLHTGVACMAGPDPMWRKSYHLFNGLFDYQNYSIVGDWEMWLRMSRSGLKFRLIPNVLCIYIDHDNTISKTNNSKLEEQKLKLKNQYKI